MTVDFTDKEFMELLMDVVSAATTSTDEFIKASAERLCAKLGGDLTSHGTTATPK